MEFRHLGSSGLKVSRIALGMMTFGTPQWRPWVLGEDEARPIVRRAVELGITFWDTANVYGKELPSSAFSFMIEETMLQAVRLPHVPHGEQAEQLAEGLAFEHLCGRVGALGEQHERQQ